MGVALSQIGWLGDVRVGVMLLVGLRTCNPCHSRCCYALLLLTFLALHFLLKTFLAAIQCGSAKRSHAAHCHEGSQDPAGSRGSTSYGQQLCTTLQYTGKDFLCLSTLDTAVTTFWLCGRQPVWECLLKILVDWGHHPPHILLHHNSDFRFGHCWLIREVSHGGEEKQSDRKLVATKTNTDVLGQGGLGYAL